LLCFGFKTLIERQKNALKYVFEKKKKKKDIFVNLPTGFGKAVVFVFLAAVVFMCGTKP